MWIRFISIAISIVSVIALNVTSISECPPLNARLSPPADVTDLRIDDIKILGALGDR